MAHVAVMLKTFIFFRFFHHSGPLQKHQEAPRAPKGAHRWPTDLPREGPRATKRPARGAQTSQERAQEPSRGHPEAAQGHKESQEATKRLHRGPGITGNYRDSSRVGAPELSIVQKIVLVLLYILTSCFVALIPGL